MTEPPHARTWQRIRTECGKPDCAYPFCKCPGQSWTVKFKRRDWESVTPARKEAA